ncbi:hypothetical protein CT0861_00569 [Colletotrichum tofieldiae]|uniref:Uncharacterized protein n=1 Tax=Colletotrichum tofieldiae TaxID=708197 RepID=A0A166PF36_9PEZI|nr:hypothetical protein CT0861_00569 [Colletotrichum tofieldiae]
MNWCKHLVEPMPMYMLCISGEELFSRQARSTLKIGKNAANISLGSDIWGTRTQALAPRRGLDKIEGRWDVSVSVLTTFRPSPRRPHLLHPVVSSSEPPNQFATMSNRGARGGGRVFRGGGRGGGGSGGGGPGRGGRSHSGPWGRLKPVDLDPLDSIGLPSKGDTRLLDFKTQERYYTKIVERYMTFCSDAGERDELLRRFASLDLKDYPSVSAASSPRLDDPGSTKSLSDVMMALRKLREGIVASKRTDEFAIQAYLFNIRLSVLVKHPESYHPAILHVLRTIHPAQNLTSVELQEVLGYLVLDAACRRGDLAEAYAIRHQYGLRDAKVDALLAALAHDNYVAFRRVKRSVDGHRAKLLEFAEAEMRTHVLKCFGRTYLAVDQDWLEKCAGESWETLTRDRGVGWELDGKKVVIRKVRAK